MGTLMGLVGPVIDVCVCGCQLQGLTNKECMCCVKTAFDILSGQGQFFLFYIGSFFVFILSLYCCLFVCLFVCCELQALP